MAADSLVIEGYRPPPDFVEDAREPLVDLNLTGSTELWLIQLPKGQNPDFDGQEVTLKLHHDGKLGSFEGSSGKEYDVVSFSHEGINPSVFVSSPSGAKIVGNISRRASLVHFPDPDELQKRNSNNVRQMYQNSSGISLTSSIATPTSSSYLRNPQSAGGRTTSKHSSRYNIPSSEVGEQSNLSRKQHSASGRRSSTHSSRQRSSLSEVGEPLNLASKGQGAQPSNLENQPTQDSGHGHSTVSVSGTSDVSQRKSKKRSRN